MTLNDFVFSNFFAISGCDTHFKSELCTELLLFYCMLYTDCQSSRTTAIARHVALLKLLVQRPTLSVYKTQIIHISKHAMRCTSTT